MLLVIYKDFLSPLFFFEVFSLIFSGGGEGERDISVREAFGFAASCTHSDQGQGVSLQSRHGCLARD